MSQQFAQDPDFTEVIHKRDIKERSDFDRDQRVDLERLGEDWGEGFHVETEPVLVQRGADGEIVRTTPLSEVNEQLEKEHEAYVEPIVAPEIPALKPLGHVEREKLVRILAVRLFKDYASRAPEDPRYNPLYDGIPEVPPGSPQNLQPIPGTKMYPATNEQVMEWLKTDVIGKRAQIQNHKFGQAYRPTLTIQRPM